MTTQEFGYTQCERCHVEYLTFTLVRGVCDWCRARPDSVRITEPKDDE